MFVETEDFKSAPLSLTPEQQDEMARKLLKSKALLDGFIEDSGVITLIPRNAKTTETEVAVWADRLRAVTTRVGYQAHITRDGVVKAARIHNSSSEKSPTRIIRPKELHFVADRYPKTFVVPESGILVDLPSYRDEFEDTETLTQEELDELMFNADQGMDIDPQRLKHRGLSQALALQVPSEYDGRRVQAILFKSGRGLSYVPDGVVIDITSQQLLPKRVVYPFMIEESVVASVGS